MYKDKMTDLELAKLNLNGHTICWCKDGHLLTSGKRGIAPMADFIAEGVNLEGYSVADVVVGKAVASLFVKSGIVGVYAKTISQGGKELLARYNIPVIYDVLTDKIVNRQGDGLCPMEQAVSGVDDIEECYIRIVAKLAELRSVN